jgi:hypothetical protein
MGGSNRVNRFEGWVRDDDRTPDGHARRVAGVVWTCVQERVMQALETVTLAQLCDVVRAEANEPLEHRYVFHI